MRPALGVLMLLAAAGWAAGWLHWRRWRSRRDLVRMVFRHVDEPLGIKAYENDRRATKRRRWSWLLPGDILDLLWPTAGRAGSAALPWTREERRYITLALPPKPWPRPWHPWDIQAMTVRWTSEAHANSPGFHDTVGRKAADALILRYDPGPFSVHDHRGDTPPRRALTFTRLPHIRVPETVTAAEDLDG